jgi:hypothetical protein
MAMIDDSGQTDNQTSRFQLVAEFAAIPTIPGMRPPRGTLGTIFSVNTGAFWDSFEGIKTIKDIGCDAAWDKLIDQFQEFKDLDAQGKDDEAWIAYLKFVVILWAGYNAGCG